VNAFGERLAVANLAQVHSMTGLAHRVRRWTIWTVIALAVNVDAHDRPGCVVLPPHILAACPDGSRAPDVKRLGTGLGLCIAAQIVASHGGRLALESTSTEGTTFTIALPVASDGQATRASDNEHC